MQSNLQQKKKIPSTFPNSFKIYNYKLPLQIKKKNLIK